METMLSLPDACLALFNPLKISFSTRLQNEADKKSLSDLMDEADEFVSPTANKPRANAVYNEVTVYENILLGMEWMLKLCEMARKMSLRHKNVKIFGVYINEAPGVCHLYFVGTVGSVMKRLKKLDNNWV